MSYEGESLECPALDDRTGVVLGQGQQDADTGVEVLGAPETPDILVETAQSKAVSRPAGDVTGSLEEIETVLGHLRYELVIRHDLTQSQS